MYKFTSKKMLTSAVKQFRYYKQLADKAMTQVDDGSLFNRLHDDDNSVAIIVQHLTGNMQSRWTNIFTEDGEKSWRKRDEEFEQIIQTRTQLTDVWENGWKVLFETLCSLTDSDLIRIIYIRNEALTVSDAIIRQLCHYSYHCGQIVYKCRQMSDGKWKSLSIPKKESDIFNSNKFGIQKGENRYLDGLEDQKNKNNDR
jgi:Protein of unknown function (DUF1572)